MCFNGLFYVYFKRLWIFFFPLSSSKCTTGLKGIIRVHHRSQKREVYRRCENWHMDFHLFQWHKQTGLYHKKCLVSLPRYLSAQFRSINNYSKNIWSWLKLYVNCKGLNIYENVMRLYVNVVWTLIRTKSLSLPRSVNKGEQSCSSRVFLLPGKVERLRYLNRLFFGFQIFPFNF